MVRLIRSRSPSHRPLLAPWLLTTLAVNYPSHRQLPWQMPSITGVSGPATAVDAYSSWSSARSVSIDTARRQRLCSVHQRPMPRLSGTPTFSWLAAAGANAYQFEYDDDPGFGSPNYTSPVLTTLTHKPPTMPLGTFYWRVRSRDAAGNWSESWSAARMITILRPSLSPLYLYLH